MEIKVDKNRLLHAPNINEALIDCIRFQNFEDILQQMLQKNNKENMCNWEQKLREAKIGVWSFVIILWTVNSIFMYQNSSGEDQKIFQNQMEEIQQFIKTFKNLEQVPQFITQKLLLRKQFIQFSENIPSLFECYCEQQKNDSPQNNLQDEIKNLIKRNYRLGYDILKHNFNLKLNYTIRLIIKKGTNEKQLQLIKREDKKWFYYVQKEENNFDALSTYLSVGMNSIDAFKSSKFLNQLNEQQEILINNQQSIQESAVDQVQVKPQVNIPIEKPVDFQKYDAQIQTSIDSKFKEFIEIQKQIDSKKRDKSVDVAIQYEQNKIHLKSQLLAEQVSKSQGPLDKNIINFQAVINETEEGEREKQNPNSFINLQLQLLEQKQKEQHLQNIRISEKALSKLEKTIWKRIKLYQMQFLIKLNLLNTNITNKQSEQAPLMTLESNSKNIRNNTNQDQLSTSQRTSLFTADRTVVNMNVLQNQEERYQTFSKINASPSQDLDQITNLNITQQDQKLLDQISQNTIENKNFQTIRREDKKRGIYKLKLERADDVRQSNSHRNKIQKNLAGRAHYHTSSMINIKKQNEDDKFDTSRFGEKNKKLENSSYNIVLVEFSSPSLSPETDISKSGFKNRINHKNQIKPKFIYPVQHIKELKKQKSPLRKSHSAKLLKNAINFTQKNQKKQEFKKISDYLIDFNKKIMLKNYNDQDKIIIKYDKFNKNGRKHEILQTQIVEGDERKIKNKFDSVVEQSRLESIRTLTKQIGKQFNKELQKKGLIK